MSILNVNQIQPVGSGQTVTISAANITASSATITANTFSGALSSSGVSTFSDTVNVGAGKSIRLYGASSGYSDIIAAAGSASTTFTLPANGGSASQYLQTDGSGALSWATLPASGKILQVQTSLYTTTNSISLSTSMVHYDLPFSVNITPLSASSKILISFSVMGEHDTTPWNSTAAFSRTISGTRTVVSATGVSNRNPGLIVPGDTYGSGGDNDSTPLQFVLSNYPDLPSTTNTITYTPTVNHSAGARTFYLNRVVTDIDDAGRERCHSWITVMEVAA